MSWFCGDNPCARSDCSYDLWAPDHRNKVINVAFSAYAFHQQQIEDFINALAETNDPNDFDNQSAAALAANLNIDSLTVQERNYIESEVAKRHVWR